MSAAEAVEGKTAIRNREYVESNISNGVDWRNRVPNAPSDARSLGTMESNGDKLTANRMKKRGMSWSIRGANRMAKTIQLCRNGELSMFCRTRTVCGSGPTMNHRPVRERPRSTTRVSDRSEASVPVLSGPTASDRGQPHCDAFYNPTPTKLTQALGRIVHHRPHRDELHDEGRPESSDR